MTHELGPGRRFKSQLGEWYERERVAAEVARAVAAERAEVLRELREWEAEYIQQARGGDNSGRSDARAGAAREIHDHLSSSWDTRAAIAAQAHGQTPGGQG